MMRCLALLALLAIAGVQAQDELYKHPLTDMPPPNEAVETAAWFPKNPVKQFRAGEVADVAVGFHNGAAEPLNITAVMGSLNSPFDFSFHVQNFSYQVYDARLQPGDEVSLEYQFFPYAQLSPREFALAITVFYHSDKQLYSTTFFNGTVDISEPASLIDSQLLFLYLMALGVLGGIAYVLYSYLANAGLVRRPRKARPAAPRAGEGSADPQQWLKGTAADPQQKAKAARKAE